MEFINNFVHVFIVYITDLWFPILLGFLLSGFFYEFIPTSLVEKFLGKKGLGAIFTASIIGTLLPICCFGTLPVALTLYRKGASLGPVLAFLVTTPATSLPALLVSWKLLGAVFTIYIFFAVIFIGLALGLIGNKLKMPSGFTVDTANGTTQDCCEIERPHVHWNKMTARVKSAFYYAFVVLPQNIGLELILGIAVASLIIAFEPLQRLIQHLLGGVWGYAVSLVAGLATYVCSTGSVPMADALLKSGVSYGPVMIYLLAGPITSAGMLFALKKEFGGKILAIYLAAISFFTLILGVAFNLLVSKRIF